MPAVFNLNCLAVGLFVGGGPSHSNCSWALNGSFGGFALSDALEGVGSIMGFRCSTVIPHGLFRELGLQSFY